jgi:integrase/recombinase XerC/integrase/recombinase XerD
MVLSPQFVSSAGPAGSASGPTLGEAVALYLVSLDHPELAGTKRVHDGTLRALRLAFDAKIPVCSLAEPDEVKELTSWFDQCWGQKAAVTYNRNLDALRSACDYWTYRAWLQGDPTSALRRRITIQGW